MQTTDDMELLRAYATRDSEAAFETLVRRHVNLVYSAAARSVRDPVLAGEITQTVFIILARKAHTLRDGTILSGWLYRTAQLAALRAIRTESRRRYYEQEAIPMQPEPSDSTWEQIAPFLEEAMAHLAATDRNAVVLRYFENKTLRDVGAALGTNEGSAQKRVARAVEKLRAFFTRRGVVVPAVLVTTALSANAVAAAPAGVFASVVAVATVKGATMGATTLTLIKGTLKLMAWTKLKTAAVVGVGLLLTAGTATVAVKEIQQHRTYDWQILTPGVDYSEILRRSPPQVRILPTKRSTLAGGAWYPLADTNEFNCIGLGVPVEKIIENAFREDKQRMALLPELPKGKYDFISNLPKGSSQALQKEIQKKFGLVGKRELRETDVLILRVSGRDTRAFKPGNGNLDMARSSKVFTNGTETRIYVNSSLYRLQRTLEGYFQLPILDETGLTNRYDFSLTTPDSGTVNTQTFKQAMREALHNQLGLELVPSRETIEMLVVRKVGK